MSKAYTITYLNPGLVTESSSTKSAALKAAESRAGLLVRVATPAGNLVTYKDNR